MMIFYIFSQYETHMLYSFITEMRLGKPTFPATKVPE